MATPSEFGPTRRRPCARTSSNSSRCNSPPSGPASAKPAEITSTARTPTRAASSTTPATSTAGTAITTSSGGSDSSASPRAARVEQTIPPDRLTGHTTPSKPPAMMLRSTRPPILVGSLEAPTTATDRGASNGRSDATLATWSRRAMRSASRSLGRMSSTSLTSSPARSPRTANPASRKTRNIWLLSASTSASKRSSPTAAACSASCSSIRVPSPRP